MHDGQDNRIYPKNFKLVGSADRYSRYVIERTIPYHLRFPGSLFIFFISCVGSLKNEKKNLKTAFSQRTFHVGNTLF